MTKKKIGKCYNRGDYLHCEVEGAIINIREGLHSLSGQKVTSVEIIPDSMSVGEQMWKVSPNVRNIRIIQMIKKYGGLS